MNDDRIKHLYENQQYNQIIELFNVSQERSDDEMKMFVGFSLTEIGFPVEAIKCLSSIENVKNKKDLGKIYRYIGLNEFMVSNYVEAKNMLIEGSTHSDHESHLWINLLFPSLFDYVEGENLIFRFVDPISPLERKIFIKKNSDAFGRISRFIGSENHNSVSKKIDIYCYTTRQDKIGNSLSYADNGMKTIHTNVGDSKGHEIAHILFNSIHESMKRNKFIDEGIATFFDEGFTYSEYMKKYENVVPNFDLLEVWNNKEIVFSNKPGLHNFAGAFVGFLIETFGKNQFIEFIRDESYENARLLFGPDFDNAIKKFYKC